MATRRLTRRQKTIIQRIHEKRRQKAGERISQQSQALGEGGLGPEQLGLVIANYGPAAIVENEYRELYRCAVRQNLGTLVCGDRVVFQAISDSEGVVVALQERRSLLTRPDYSGRPKPIAANLDQVAIVVAPKPEFSEFLVDRYLVAIAAMNIDPLLVVNKIDLLNSEERAVIENRLATYRHIDCPMLLASIRTAHGLDNLREYLKGRTNILVGQSGVGKSSLIKALLPEREIRIQSVSEATGHGTHTTTTATLYHLPDGGDLIDSPGVRSFEPVELDPADLNLGFPEFAPYWGCCKFSNCSHTVEPDCALMKAVKQGKIDPRRLESYRQMKKSLLARQTDY
jgi:ribosome biogenesis GTPase